MSDKKFSAALWITPKTKEIFNEIREKYNNKTKTDMNVEEFLAFLLENMAKYETDILLATLLKTNVESIRATNAL